MTSPVLASLFDEDRGLVWPARALEHSSPLLDSVLQMNAATSRLFMHGRAQWADRVIAQRDLVAVWLRFETATFAAGSQLRIRTCGTDRSAAIWRADGVYVQEFLGALGVGPVASTMQRFAFDLPRTLARLEEFSIELDYAQFQAASNLQVMGASWPTEPTATSAGRDAEHFCTSTSNGVSFSVHPIAPCLVLEFADGTFGAMRLGFPFASATVRTYNSTTVIGTAVGSQRGNERGGRFTVPSTRTVAGVILPVTVSASAAAARAILYEGTTEIARTNDLYANQSTSGTSLTFRGLFETAVTLVPGVEYFIVLVPLNATSVSLNVIAVLDADWVSESDVTQLFHTVSRVNTDPAWSAEDPLEFFVGALIVTAIYADVPIPEPEPEPPAPVYGAGMNWDQVVAAFMAELAAAPEITAIFGDRIRLASPKDFAVPLLEVTVIGDTEGELWAPVTIQVDLWADEFTSVRDAERYIRGRYYAPLPIPIGALTCWAQYSDGTNLAVPERDGFFGRAIRFTFTPLRAAYQGG